MRIVVKDRRYNSSGRKYTMDIQIDYKSIPEGIPLTDRVISHYKTHKSIMGYATFRGLNRDDIISILSAVKRQQACVNVERYGNTAFYSII